MSALGVSPQKQIYVFILPERVGGQAGGHPFYLTMTGGAVMVRKKKGQLELAFLFLVVGLKRVPDEVVASWQESADVLKWTFENRRGGGGKPVDLFAFHLKRRRQTIYKMVNGEYKIDPTETNMWDKLTGWSGFEQFLDKFEREEKEAMAQAIQEVIKQGLFPTRRAA